MGIRYDVRDGGNAGWIVDDLWTGMPAIIDGFVQTGLSFEDADDLADALNHLHTKQAEELLGDGA